MMKKGLLFALFLFCFCGAMLNAMDQKDETREEITNALSECNHSISNKVPVIMCALTALSLSSVFYI